MRAEWVWSLSIVHTFAFGVCRMFVDRLHVVREWALVSAVLAFAAAVLVWSRSGPFGRDHLSLAIISGGLVFLTAVAYFAETAVMLVATCAMVSTALSTAQVGLWTKDEYVGMHATLHALQHAIVVGLIDALCAIRHTYTSSLLVVVISLLTISATSLLSWLRLHYELKATNETLTDAPTEAIEPLNRRAAHLSGDMVIDIVTGLVAVVVTVIGLTGDNTLRICSMLASRLVLAAGILHYQRERDCELVDLSHFGQLSRITRDSLNAVQAHLRADDEQPLQEVTLAP